MKMPVDPEGFLAIFEVCKKVDEQLIKKSEETAPKECSNGKYSCVVFKRCHGRHWNPLTDLYSCEQIVKYYLTRN